MIECKNITLSYKGQPVFNNFNLKIEKGEFICVTGESGKGKSTLLRLIQGFERPQLGEVVVDGEKLNETNVSFLRNKMVWIPQNVHLPVATGAKLMELLGVVNLEEIVNDNLHSLQLDEKILHKDFSEISGGQKQRLIIAICLSIQRPIVLLDEPTSSLDEASINLLISLVLKLSSKTIVSASHNATWVSNVDKVISL